jgi:hypothetical protein
MDALLAILLLKQPLAESFRVFSNPVKIPQWILPSNYRTQRVLFSCACLHTVSMPTWQSIFSQNFQQFCPLCAPMHLLNAHLAELSESSVILFFFLNSQQSSSFVHSLHWLNAHLAELHRILSDSGFCLNSQQSSSTAPLCICSMPTWQSFTELTELLSATVSLIHSLASKVFNNLEVFPELLIPVLVPQHVFV